MEWTTVISQFIADHLQDDTVRLLFSAHRYPHLDMPFIVEQIEARRRLRTKLPEWYANPDLLMCGRIPAEQCSSEQTARYKHTLLEGCHSLCDMTGGMGVDFWYMSRGLDRAIYTECQPHLCAAARHNFAALSSVSVPSSDAPCANASHSTELGSVASPVITIREGLSTLLPIPDVDAIYLDPARRSDTGSRIYEIEDCEPNVIAWQDDLLAHCSRLITKVSPMADLRRTLQRLKHVTDVHVVSVRNECKELLIVQQGHRCPTPQPSAPLSHLSELGSDVPPSSSSIALHCIDFLPSATIAFHCPLSELSGSAPVMQGLDAARYLYEPDVSLMKAQAFAPLAQRFPVQMLDANTHLFASDQCIPDFPGRSFVIDEVIEFSSRQLKQLRKRVPQANLATRNFPLSPEELRTRTGIRDGGSVYLFGCQVCQVGPVFFLCHKIV